MTCHHTTLIGANHSVLVKGVAGQEVQAGVCTPTGLTRLTYGIDENSLLFRGGGGGRYPLEKMEFGLLSTA